METSLNVKLAMLVVKSIREPHVVKPFPRVLCACPASGMCYHVVTAQTALGLEEPANVLVAEPQY